MIGAEVTVRRALPMFTLVAAATLSLSLDARAQADSAGAEALFREGKRLMDEARYAEACPKLAESYRLDPATGALLATALCYERAGRLASAWAAYTEAAARSKQEGRADREESARAKALELEPRLAKVTVELEAGAGVSGLVVTRDGVALGEGVLGTALPVDPGTHVVEARAPGRRAFSVRVESTEGKTARVAVPVLATEGLAPAAPPATAEKTAPDEGSSEEGFFTPLRTTGIVVTGVGVVGLAIGGVFGAKALSLNAQSNEHCVDNACEPEAYDQRTEARRAGNLSTVFVATGVGLAAVGITLFVLGAPDDPEGTASITAIPGGALSRLRIRF